MAPSLLAATAVRPNLAVSTYAHSKNQYFKYRYMKADGSNVAENVSYHKSTTKTLPDSHVAIKIQFNWWEVAPVEEQQTRSPKEWQSPGLETQLVSTNKLQGLIPYQIYLSTKCLPLR